MLVGALNLLWQPKRGVSSQVMTLRNNFKSHKWISGHCYRCDHCFILIYMYFLFSVFTGLWCSYMHSETQVHVHCELFGVQKCIKKGIQATHSHFVDRMTFLTQWPHCCTETNMLTCLYCMSTGAPTVFCLINVVLLMPPGSCWSPCVFPLLFVLLTFLFSLLCYESLLPPSTHTRP